MKRNWFARHPIGFMALYFLLYLSAFNFLETQISMPRVLLVHCRLDDLIPFCKYAILPYFAWFAWIPFTLFYLLWKAPREDFWRLCLPLFGGMTIALACYVILPTGLDLRPYYVPGTDLFARAVRMLYRTDTATNVCPSIHVFNSVTLMLAYHRCRCAVLLHRVFHHAAQAAQLHRRGAGCPAGTGAGCPVQPRR